MKGNSPFRTAMVLSALALAGVVGCGDPETTDRRGYTKAPLEQPGFVVEGEPVTEMDRLGEPDRPRPEVLELPEAGQAASSQRGS